MSGNYAAIRSLRQNKRVNRTARGGFVLKIAIVLKEYASIKLFGDSCCPLPLTLGIQNHREIFMKQNSASLTANKVAMMRAAHQII